MSILNIESDGLFNSLIVLVRCLVCTGPIKKDKLLALCAPSSCVEQKRELTKKTLRRWTQIGFFTEDDETIRLSEEHPTKLTKRNLTNELIASTARYLMFSARNNVRFWEAENNMSADMCRITCWILAQDVHELRPKNFDEPEALYLEQLESDEKIFQNDTRWNGFKSWCAFLGFGATESGKSKGVLIVDPTRAIRQTVIGLLADTRESPVMDFLRELANEVPVLDRGTYRAEVESRLRRDKWKEPLANEVSTSLSRALLRLESQGVLRLEKRSDSIVQVQLLGRGGKTVRSVTHVQHGGAK